VFYTFGFMSMPKIQFASDLHLEFPENRKFLQKNPIHPMADILVLAGDIVPFAAMHVAKEYWQYVSDHFQLCFWIPGNHEYYHSDLTGKSGKLDEKIMNNVYLVNNTSVNWLNTKLIFSTLWTHIGVQNEFTIQQSLNDFHVIKNGDYFLTTHQYNALHRESISFLSDELRNAQQAKNIVFTHHVPTLMNYPPQYKGSALNEAFAIELFELIETSQPDYWIYGHSHVNTPQFQIGNTKLCTNQLGYVSHNEHQTFSCKAFLEI